MIVFISSKFCQSAWSVKLENCRFYQTTRRSITEGVAVLGEILADHSTTTLDLHMSQFSNVALIISGNLEWIWYERVASYFQVLLLNIWKIEDNLSHDIHRKEFENGTTE
jgi:hypothetical protein